MNRKQIISDVFVNQDMGTFAGLSMPAQVAVVYRTLRSVLNNVSYWEKRADEHADDPLQAEWKLCEQMREQYARCLPGLYQFLQRASHYSEGVEQQIEFDTSTFDDYGDQIGGSEWQSVTLNGNPYGWPKRILIEAGLWDEEIDFSTEHKLMLPDLGRVADRFCGQMVARMMLVLGSGDSYEPRRTDARDFEIMTLSPSAISIAKMSEAQRFRAAYSLALKHLPYGVTKEELVTAFEEITILDEDDALQSEIKADRREMRKVTNEVIREAARHALLAETVARLKAAGLNDELIAATVASMK